MSAPLFEQGATGRRPQQPYPSDHTDQFAPATAPCRAERAPASGTCRRSFVYHRRVIRLRQSLERGLRHPLLGPLLLLLLGLALAFLIFHAIEHGVEGQLFTCVFFAAAVLRLVVVIGRARRIRLEGRVTDRAPPRFGASQLLRAPRPPASLFAPPLRL